MSEFPTQRLDEFIADGSVLLGRGDVISKDDIEAHPGPYPIYSSSAHNNGKFGEYGKFMFDEELITWSVDGGGYFFYRPKHKYSVTNVCGYMRLRGEKLHPKFVYYSLANQHRFLTFDYTTKAHPSVIKKQYWLPIIAREQQQKIASILTSIDTNIEKTEALIAKYQQIKAGLMHELFTRGVTADGKLRPPRAQAPELYQETPIGWIPKEWEIMPLDEHVRIIDCKHYTPEFQSEGIPFIRPRNIKVDGLDLTSLDYVSAHDYQILTDIYRPRCGDIVFSRNASFGVPCYIDTDIQFAIGQDCVIMTTKTSDTRYIFCALTNSITASQIAKVSGGSTFGRINLGEIRKLMIPYPGREEEHRIADRLFVHSDVSKSLKDELAKLHQQKLGLMHDLLTGCVRVKSAETDVVPA